MTVSEMIEALKNYPSDMRILTPGYQGGFHDVDVLKIEDMVFNVNGDSKECVIMASTEQSLPPQYNIGRGK